MEVYDVLILSTEREEKNDYIQRTIQGAKMLSTAFELILDVQKYKFDILHITKSKLFSEIIYKGKYMGKRDINDLKVNCEEDMRAMVSEMVGYYLTGVGDTADLSYEGGINKEIELWRGTKLGDEYAVFIFNRGRVVS